MTRGVARVAAALICATVAAIAVPAAALAAAPPKLAVTAAALYAPATGQMLDGVDANREHPIASTTKLMTALIVLQHVHDLNTVYTYPDYHAGGVRFPDRPAAGRTDDGPRPAGRDDAAERR